MSRIPVVDLGDFSSSGASDAQRARSARFSETLRDGLCEFGFILVEGHGIDPRLIRVVYAHFETLFDGDGKLACSGVAGGQRGFTPFGLEHARDCDAPDLKEFFHIGQENPGDAGPDRYPANVWPTGQPGLRDDALRLFVALEDCAMVLLEALAAGFELPRDAFAGMVRGGNSILRALHYPPVSLLEGGRSIRAAAHEDINLITLLCEATEPGLEIRPPGQDEWLPVEVAPGRIVVDAGDMLSRMTNGVVPATTHRVVNPGAGSDVDRYSLPFFAHPRPECDLSVLSRFVSGTRPRRHPPITAGDFLDERLREIGLLS